MFCFVSTEPFSPHQAKEYKAWYVVWKWPVLYAFMHIPVCQSLFKLAIGTQHLLLASSQNNLGHFLVIECWRIHYWSFFWRAHLQWQVLVKANKAHAYSGIHALWKYRYRLYKYITWLTPQTPFSLTSYSYNLSCYNSGCVFGNGSRMRAAGSWFSVSQWLSQSLDLGVHRLLAVLNPISCVGTVLGFIPPFQVSKPKKKWPMCIHNDSRVT